MSKKGIVFLFGLVVLIAGCGNDEVVRAQPGTAKPNILFVFTDDQGWNDISVAMDDQLPGSGSDYYRTPNIERIADAGMVFSRAYSAAPMCGPSRMSFHSGINAARSVYSSSSDAVQAESLKVGQMMRSAGYATAHFGKWSPGPPEEGLGFYDASDGNADNSDGNVNEPGNPKDIFGITERALAFIEDSVAADKPFYLHLSHYAPHMQVHALDDTVEKWNDIPGGEVHTNPAYAAMTENLDTGVGMVLDKLEELGVADNTYVIYTSDHGQAVYASTNEPLAWGKGTLWDGGLRVPLIISGPGITPGTSSDAQTVSLDFFPTFAELAQVAGMVPDDIDGGSLVPILFNDGEGEIERRRDDMIFHFAQPSGQPNSVAASSIYVDEYKLIEFYDTGELHLYDIYKDPGEQNNLAVQMPDRVDQMHARLTDYLEAVDARIPEASTARGPTPPGSEPAFGAGMGAGGGGMGMGGGE